MECLPPIPWISYSNKFQVLTDNSPLTYVLRLTWINICKTWCHRTSLACWVVIIWHLHKIPTWIEECRCWWTFMETTGNNSEDNVRSICNGILSQKPGQVGVIRVHLVQAVDWCKRQAADDAICCTASLLKVGRGHHIRWDVSYQMRQNLCCASLKCLC